MGCNCGKTTVKKTQPKQVKRPATATPTRTVPTIKRVIKRPAR